jgi:hypothetical protein
VWGTVGNGSCGFQAALGVLRLAIQSGKLEPYFAQLGLDSDKTFRERFQAVLSCAENANEDLQAGGVRKILCKYGLSALLEFPDDDPLKQLLLKNWNRRPDDEMYAVGEAIACGEGICTDFETLDEPIQVACMNAVSILDPQYYFDVSAALILQQYFLGRFAFVVITNSRRRKGNDLMPECGKRARGRHIDFSHSPLRDFVHPTLSVFWFPMLQRERNGACNHYELLTPADGSCPVLLLPLGL